MWNHERRATLAGATKSFRASSRFPVSVSVSLALKLNPTSNFLGGGSFRPRSSVIILDQP